MLLLLAYSVLASAQEDTTAISESDYIGNNDMLIVGDSVINVHPQKVNSNAINYWKPNPTRSLWYSVICPGLGQVYNRSYWKVPIIYGGGAVFAYLIQWQGRMYKEYSNAYYDFMDNDPNTNSYESIFRNINGTDEWKAKTLKQKRDYYRRYRDMCVFGVSLLYVLNVLDAFVDGHLYDFNVSEDLSLHVEPVVNIGGNTSYGVYDTPSLLGVQCNIKF